MKNIQLEEGMCLKMQEIKIKTLKRGKHARKFKKMSGNQVAQLRYSCQPKLVDKKSKFGKCGFFITFERIDAENSEIMKILDCHFHHDHEAYTPNQANIF